MDALDGATTDTRRKREPNIAFAAVFAVMLAIGYTGISGAPRWMRGRGVITENTYRQIEPVFRPLTWYLYSGVPGGDYLRGYWRWCESAAGVSDPDWVFRG